jgi:uncharacterized protein YjbI with pentapeptide repeats
MPYIDVNTCLKDKVFQKSDNVNVESRKLVFSYIDFGSLSLHHNGHIMLNEEMIDLKRVANTSNTNGYDLFFKDCKFSAFNAVGITWNKSIVIKSSLIEKVKIKSSFFKERFYVNPQYREDQEEYICKIPSFIVEDTTFEHNFKLHNCEIDLVNINNTDFEKNADFFKSKFLQSKPIEFKSINFRGLALFGDCEFKDKLLLEYVTFEKLSHFREATFENGLDLEKSNIEKEMNFYGAKELNSNKSKKATSQETYRIIKYNFQKVGNIIEANRYHSLELEKRKNFLDTKKDIYFYDWLMFQLNWMTSRFSTNWARVVCWICAVGALTIFFNYFTIFKDLFFHPNHFKIDYISKAFNAFFKYISIFNVDKSFYNSNPMLFFLNKVALGYLYYQFIVAVRKDTKR